MRARAMVVVGALVLVGCDDCMDQLEARAEHVQAVPWPSWDATSPEPHLVLRGDMLVWDAATEIFHEAERTSRCPDPLPPAARIVGRFERGELVRDGLYAHLRGGAPLRIDAGVPYTRVAMVFDAYRRAGFHEVELRQLRCTATACSPERLRVGLSSEHGLEGAELLALPLPGESRRVPPSRPPPLQLDGLDDPIEEEKLELLVRETETGWQLSGSGGRFEPGCRRVTAESIDTVSRADGIDGLVECLERVKEQFPDEWSVRVVPRGETLWRYVAAQLGRIRVVDGRDLFPVIVFPDPR